MAEQAILYDASKCSACKGCQVMCKQWNMLPSSLGKDVHKFSGSYQAPMDLAGSTRLIITFAEKEGGPNYVEWAFGRRSCNHCTDASCEKVCPVGAIYYTDNGTVKLNTDMCIGCQFCVSACPWHVPKFRENKGYTDKCTLCVDRAEQGRSPACVQTCPGAALHFGDRHEMIAKGKERVSYLMSKGFDKAELYGETQMGGLHIIQVAKYGLEAHGLVRNPEESALVKLVDIAKPVTGVAMAAVVLGLGASFMTGIGYDREDKTLAEYQADRREVLAQKEADKSSRGEM